jgi:uncharacterized protein (TIGR03000 family)
MKRATIGSIVRGIMFLASWGASEGYSLAQDSLPLKNSMSAPITVRLQGAEGTKPVDLQLRVNDTFDFNFRDRSLYSIQVIPADQKNSGYDLGTYDLREVARQLRGAPFELDGEFEIQLDPETQLPTRVRTAVLFNAPDPRTGVVTRFRSARADYSATAQRDAEALEEPTPTPSSAVISVVVHPNATIHIDGEPTRSTGRKRHYVTPDLDRDRENIYNLSAEWVENGVRFSSNAQVRVRPGEVSRVVFQLPIIVSPMILVPAAPPAEKIAD